MDQDKKARPDIIFDKENTWWAYVQPQEYPRVVGYGTTLRAALQSLLDQLQVGPQQWMIACAAATLEQHTMPDQATNRGPGSTTQPDLSVHTFAQESGSNSGSSTSIPPTLSSAPSQNPRLIAQPATADTYLHNHQQLSESIVRGIRQKDTSPMYRLMSSSAAFTASINRHQQGLGMTPIHKGPWSINFSNSAGFMLSSATDDNVVSAAATNPAVSQPFLQGALTPSSFDQTTSDDIQQLSAPVHQAAQIEHDFPPLPAHDASIDVTKVDQTSQGDEMYGGQSQTSNPGVDERARKPIQVEENSQKIEVEQQSKAIQLEDQPSRPEIGEQLQKIKVEDRPSKKIKIEHPN